MGYHRSQFHRLRRLMPERDRLASNLVLVAPIRSDDCRQDAEISFRPALEQEKCSCLIADHKLELDRFVITPLPFASSTNEGSC